MHQRCASLAHQRLLTPTETGGTSAPDTRQAKVAGAGQRARQRARLQGVAPQLGPGASRIAAPQFQVLAAHHHQHAP